ncbi:MAG: two-component regulator propeller domain-containing protein, partial [Bacteroidota bacterium]
MHSWPYTILLLWLFCLGHPVLTAQGMPLPHAIHFDSNAGLPSTEVYCVLEDRRGFMWFGTDNGVVRYDGYSFVTYGSPEGIDDPVVFSLVEGADGRLYACSGLSNQVFVWSSATDRFFSHSVNEKLPSYPSEDPLKLIKLVHVGEKDTMVFSTPHYGLLLHTKARPFFGLDTLLALSDSLLIPRRLGVVHDNPTTALNSITFYRVQRSLDLARRRRSQANIFFFDQRASLGFIQHITHSASLDYYRTFSFLHIAAGDSTYVTLQKGDQIHLTSAAGYRRFPTPISLEHPNFYYRLPDNTFLLGFNKGEGLIHYQSLADLVEGKGQKLLDNCNASYAAMDRKGGLWITTLDKGVFYYPDLNVRVYDEKQDLPSSKTISLQALGQQMLVAGYETNDVCVLKIGQQDSLAILAHMEARFQPRMFFYDTVDNIVYSKNSLIHLKNLPKNGLQATSSINVTSSLQPGYGALRMNPYHPDTALFSSYHGPALFDLRKREVIKSSRILNERGIPSRNRANDYLILASDKHLVATHRGLFELKKDKTLQKNNLGSPALDARVDMMLMLPDSSVLFATRGRGVVRYNRGNFTILDEEAGLASNLIRHLHVATDQTLWVSTFNGISQVCFKDLTPSTCQPGDTARFTIRTYTTAHGLPSNEVHQIATEGDKIWLATSSGLTDFVIPSRDTSSIQPRIQRFLVNGAPYTTD